MPWNQINFIMTNWTKVYKPLSKRIAFSNVLHCWDDFSRYNITDGQAGRCMRTVPFLHDPEQ